MPFPTVTTSTPAIIASNQAVKLIITVTGLSTLADKVVALSVQFTGVANNDFGYFAKFVSAADTSTTFTITVPYPDDISPASLVVSDVIHVNTLRAEYYFVAGNPSPLNG